MSTKVSTNSALVDNSTLWKVIWASSLGTLIEWYDFYIFGTLAFNINNAFFPSENPTAGLLATLATFAVGFLVRPFGALVFGRLGDMIGRKYTFLVTLSLMGISTFLIGCVPGYATIGFAAPLIIILLRVVQGLALGGEYGGAATYVSEHVTEKDRGFYTSWIQTTATIGLFVSLLVILLTKQFMGADAFADWGWRVPFLISILLVMVSVYIRLSMQESPVFTKIKAEGKGSTNPLKESFGKKENMKMVLLALFGATAGQGVIWYTGQFYANSFLQNVMNIEEMQRIYLMLVAIALATPFFVIFGSLSDKIGRKWIMMIGMLLGVLTYQLIYHAMHKEANTNDKLNTVYPVTDKQSSTTWALIKDTAADSTKTTTIIQTLSTGSVIKDVKLETCLADKTKATIKPIEARTVWLSSAAWWMIVFFVFIQILYVTMVYGPIAAFLVELFPPRIRYSSMSLPYHIGNGVFGGLVPFIATALTVGGTLPFNGLFYPMAVAAICFVIGVVFIPNNHINKESEEHN
jgi:MFS family permease